MNRPKTISPKALRKLAMVLFKKWQVLEAASKTDLALKGSADELYKTHSALHHLGCVRETEAAERKDRRLGTPVLWEVFTPDNVLGMRIQTRTPHRMIQQRLPTWVDVAGIAFFGTKKDLERYLPEAHARPDFYDPWQDLDQAMHGYGWDPEKALAKTLTRIDEVQVLWGSRFERERAEEDRRRREEERWAV